MTRKQTFCMHVLAKLRTGVLLLIKFVDEMSDFLPTACCLSYFPTDLSMFCFAVCLQNYLSWPVTWIQAIFWSIFELMCLGKYLSRYSLLLFVIEFLFSVISILYRRKYLSVWNHLVSISTVYPVLLPVYFNCYKLLEVTLRSKNCIRPDGPHSLHK